MDKKKGSKQVKKRLIAYKTTLMFLLNNFFIFVVQRLAENFVLCFMG